MPTRQLDERCLELARLVFGLFPYRDGHQLLFAPIGHDKNAQRPTGWDDFWLNSDYFHESKRGLFAFARWSNLLT